jgi:hypothetical protein
MEGLITIKDHWKTLSNYGNLEPLHPSLFISQESEIFNKLYGLLIDLDNNLLKVDTNDYIMLKNTVASFVNYIEEDDKNFCEDNIFILSKDMNFNAISKMPPSNVFVLDFEYNSEVVQMFLSRGHSIIYGDYNISMHHGNTCEPYTPSEGEIKEALINSNINEEIAQVLIDKSDGCLNTLLELIQCVSPFNSWRVQDPVLFIEDMNNW